MADFLSSDAYPWLRPQHRTPNEMLPAMEFGARLKQQAIHNELQQKELQLQQDRQMIQVQEYFSKKELQNKILEGNAELAKTASQFSDPGDPAYPAALWNVAAKYPEQVNTPHFDGLLKRHENAVLAREKLQQYGAQFMERIASAERIAAGRNDAYGVRTEYQKQIADAKLKLQDMMTNARSTMDFARAENFAASAELAAKKASMMGETTQTKNLAAADQMDLQADAITAVDPDAADRLRNNADLLRGSIRRAVTGGGVSSDFVPEEKNINGIRMMRVSPQRWAIVDKPIATGKMADIDREKIRSLRNERNAIELGDTPVRRSDEKEDAFKRRVEGYNNRLKQVSDIQARISEVEAKYQGQPGAPAQPVTAPNPQAPPPAPTSGKRVSVIAPNGIRGSIPEDQLEAAKAAGYRVE